MELLCYWLRHINIHISVLNNWEKCLDQSLDNTNFKFIFTFIIRISRVPQFYAGYQSFRWKQLVLELPLQFYLLFNIVDGPNYIYYVYVIVHKYSWDLKLCYLTLKWRAKTEIFHNCILLHYSENYIREWSFSFFSMGF